MKLSEQILLEGISCPSSSEVPQTTIFFCHCPTLSQKISFLHWKAAHRNFAQT